MQVYGIFNLVILGGYGGLYIFNIFGGGMYGLEFIYFLYIQILFLVGFGNFMIFGSIVLILLVFNLYIFGVGMEELYVDWVMIDIEV